MRLQHYGHTDIGRKRSHNEDAYLADGDLGLFIVCDGVGGRARGEVASSETVEMIWDWIKREESMIAHPSGASLQNHVSSLCRILRSAIQNACYMLHSLGQMNPEQQGMSTTASAVLVVNAIAIVGQVGDSRVYLHREGSTRQLTEDHTLINYQLKHGLITEEEAKRSKSKNVITRAVGHKDYVEVDTIALPLFGGDRIFLCSDGLHGYLDEESRHDPTLHQLMELEIEEAVNEAVRLANERGGKDNITALMVEALDH